MPNKKPSTATPKPHDVEKPTFANKLIDQVLDRIELDELSAVVAERMCEKMAGSLDVDRLATTLFDIHGEELKKGLVNAIVHRL